MDGLFLAVFMVGLAAVAYAAFNYVKIKMLPEGTETMQYYAQAIRGGAREFLICEYKVLTVVVTIVALLLGILTQWQSAVAVIFGTIISGAAGWFGMRCATYTNVRVANTARTTHKVGETTKVAFRGGSVMGLLVSGLALLGLTGIFVIFSFQTVSFDMIDPSKTLLGISFQPFTMTLSSFGLGCSIIALFNRVGGGIYTKAADMGSDNAGKIEEGIPEDDPRNPGVICDNVGDNVGDTAGLGSDILESYVGAQVAAIALTIFMYNRLPGFSETLFLKMYVYPILFCMNGLIASILGIAYVLHRPMNEKEVGEDTEEVNKTDKNSPQSILNMGTYISAGGTALLNLIATIVIFHGESFEGTPFIFGVGSLYLAPLFGIISGIVIGSLAEYYTSSEYKPTQRIAKVSVDGAANTIVEGLSVGMKSTLSMMAVLAGVMILAYVFGGFIAVALAGVGMLSFTGITVTVDTYGPISDNAGGIAELSGLEVRVRKITDLLDSVGNTTAAIGKGFAIGSAAFAATGLMISFLCAFIDPSQPISLDFMNIWVLAGALIGVPLIFYFSGMLMTAVSDAASVLVEEIRRQFNEIPGLRDKDSGVRPDSNKCVRIVTQKALHSMKRPSTLAVAIPLALGFLFGGHFVAGLLMGAILSAIALAIFCGNAGGAWDNAKKLIEEKGLKGTLQHASAVIGDTVGDPLKDTVGPSLDIFIKIMSTVSLIMVPVFNQYNLVAFISQLLAK